MTTGWPEINMMRANGTGNRSREALALERRRRRFLPPSGQSEAVEGALDPYALAVKRPSLLLLHLFYVIWTTSNSVSATRKHASYIIYR